ncbi:NUDIX hydrolase [Dactylosporangium vinaceum]|nr:NUDIX hydrolase [Dactylosporangium vinaceum]
MTVDLVILTVYGGDLQVLIVERGNEPFRGSPALPGGFLRSGEGVYEAAVRELWEETRLDGEKLPLRQLEVFGAPDRDPRGRIVTVPYLAIAPNLPPPEAGSDATAAALRPVRQLLTAGASLAFDHDDILRLALEETAKELEHSTIATEFCGETFTIGELRAIYEMVWDRPLDPRNFNRKVTRTDGFLEPVGTRASREPGRPAMLYRAGPAKRLYPPILRSAEGED